MEPSPQAQASPADPAFHALVDRLHGRMFRLAARLLGSATDAEDVVQDAFLRTFRAVRAGAIAPGALDDGLLVTTVSRLALNHRRGRTRQQARDAAYPAPSQTAGADALLALRDLDELLAVLPAPQRAALVLKELEGMSTREVAAVLGCSEGAVEQRLVRAKQTLRERSR